MTNTLSGKVQVSTPGAPAIRVEVAHSGTVAVSPGMVGPQGGGVRLDGAVASYADLPTGLGVEDAGASYVTQDDGLLYVWSGTAWPAEGAGSQFRGDKGDRGTGVESVSVDGSDLSFGLSDGTSRRVTVPALVEASAAAVDAGAAADRAVSARTGAEDARDGAVDAADRAEGAADGVAADAVAAGDAAGRAEVAADAADASATAAGVSAGEAAASAEATAVDAAAVDDAREYVSWVHEDLSPGGNGMTLIQSLANATVDYATQARDARDAAAGHADRAEAAAAGVDQAVSDAAGVLAGELADDVAAAQAARSGAEAARDQAVGAASTATTKAGEAAASATLADGRASDAEGAVASIAAHATAAEGAATRAAASESNAAGSATEAQGHADRAATEAGAAAQIAAAEKIAQLVGDAPANLDTIYELAAAFEDRGDAIAAIQDALANRVMGNHSSVISSTIPGAGTPTNQVTFVVEGT